MPSTKAHTYLELPSSPNVDPAFQRSLNDTLRQIAQQFDSLTTGTGVKTKTVTSSGGTTATVSGGQLIFYVPGTLATMSGIGPLVSFPGDITPTGLVAVLESASQGSPVKAQVNVAGTKYAIATLAKGATLSTTTSTFAKIPANSLISLDVIAGGVFPGAGLTIMLRF